MQERLGLKDGTQGMEKRIPDTQSALLAALVDLRAAHDAGQLFQQVYTMADSAIVGRLVGEGRFGGSGRLSPLTNVFISIAIGGGVGASVINCRPLAAGSMPACSVAGLYGAASFLGISLLKLGGVGLPWPPDHGAAAHPENILDDATTLT